MSKNPTHEEMLHRLTSQERDALTQLYAQYWQDVISHATSSLRVSASESNVHTIAHSVLDSLANHHLNEIHFGDRDSILQVLMETTLRHCRKHQKRWERHRHVSLEALASRSGENQSYDPPASETPAEEITAWCEVWEMLSEQLSEQDWNILQHWLNGQTIEKTAEALLIATATVKRGRARIRKIAMTLADDTA